METTRRGLIGTILAMFAGFVSGTKKAAANLRSNVWTFTMQMPSGDINSKHVYSLFVGSADERKWRATGLKEQYEKPAYDPIELIILGGPVPRSPKDDTKPCDVPNGQFRVLSEDGFLEYVPYQKIAAESILTVLPEDAQRLANGLANYGYVGHPDKNFLEHRPLDRLLKERISKDMDFAWSIHKHMVTCFMEQGLDRVAANRGAAKFMKEVWGADTESHPSFQRPFAKL